MADWLKIRHALVRSSKIRGLMRALRCKRHTALGLALDWLVWIDEQTEDGKTHLLPDELADEIGFRGCADALIEVGWAALGSDGCVEAVEFGKHCGESAKKRAENALRQARFKANNAKSNAKNVTEVTQKVTPKVTQARYQNRIEENNNTEGRGSTTVDVGAAVEPPLPPPAQNGEVPESFRRWREALCGAVPQLAAFRTLPPDVELAARQTYNCLPQAADYAPLLAAYYADRMPEDSRRVPFWRPMGAQFFRELADVIFKHAQRWQKETGWRKNTPESHENTPKTARKGSGGQLQRTGGKNALEAYQKRMNEKYGINDT